MTDTTTSPDLTSGLWTWGWPGLTTANPQAITFMSLASSVYKSGAPMLYDPDLSRRRDPATWDKIMLDDDFRPAWMQRLAKVTRREWTLEPGDESEDAAKKAKIMDALLRECKGLYEARRHLEHAAMWGYAPVWTRGSREWRSPAGLLGEWWAPVELQTLDFRQVALKAETERTPDGKDRVRVVPYMATIDTGTHAPVGSPECLTIHVWGNDTLDRKGYGRGLDEPLYVLVWIKSMVRTILLQGYEKWANGIADVAVDASAHAATDQESATVAQEHADAVAAMRQLGYYIHDNRDKLTVVGMSGTGSQVGIDLLKMLGEAITRIVLNSVLPSGQASGAGSLARAGEEGKTTDDVMDAERDLLDDVVTERIVRLMDKLNAPMWAELGLVAAPCPRFSSVADEHENPEMVASVYEAAQRIGLKVSRSEAHRRLKIAEPKDEADVLEAPQPPAPTFGGFGGGGESPFGGPPAPKFGDEDKPGDGTEAPTLAKAGA